MGIFLILISSALANNIIVAHIIGIDPALGFMRRHKVAYGISRTMLLLLPIVVCLGSVMTHFVLIPMQLQYLQTFVFVLLIIIIIYALKKWATIPAKTRVEKEIQPEYCLRSDLNIFLPLAGINTMVIGTLFLDQQQDHHFLYSLFFGLGTAIGFSMILIILTFISERLQIADVPAPFKGIPIMLITLSLISMAFLGFSGLVT